MLGERPPTGRVIMLVMGWVCFIGIFVIYGIGAMMD